MKLLFVESSREGWGTEQHCAALATAMASRAHSVRALLSVGSAIEAPLRLAGIPVDTVRFRSGADPRLLRILLRLARDFRPDWYITNDGKLYWPLVILAKLTRSRCAVFRHWTGIRRRLTRWLLPRLADRFILVSEAAREAFGRAGIPDRLISVLHNPVDVGRFQPNAEAPGSVRRDFGWAETDRVVGYVGRIVHEKGIFVLFDAIEAVFDTNPAIRMLWVGGGVGLPELRARISASRHSARHRIQTWTANIEVVYPAIDVLCVPSIYAEPFGRVSIEAQACGTPVLCSAIGGLPETLSIGGLLVPPGDPVALTVHLVRLLGSDELHRSMAIAGRAFVSGRFSTEAIGSKFEKLLQVDYRSPSSQRAQHVQTGIPAR